MYLIRQQRKSQRIGSLVSITLAIGILWCIGFSNLSSTLQFFVWTLICIGQCSCLFLSTYGTPPRETTLIRQYNASNGTAETVTSARSPAVRSIGSSFETAAHHAVEKDPGVWPRPTKGISLHMECSATPMGAPIKSRPGRGTYAFSPLCASVSY